VERPLFVFDAGPGEEARARARLQRALGQLPEGSLLYLSGFLLDRLTPALLEKIRRMVQSGHVELLGGGLYSPYLPLLPERDASWQLADMAERLEDLFGAQVEGAYLSDGAFDLTRLGSLAEEDYRYALLPRKALAHPAYAEVDESGVWLIPYEKNRAFFGPRRPQSPFPAGWIEGGDHPRALVRQCERAADLFAKMRWVSDKLEEAKRPPEEAYERLYRGQWGRAYRGQDEAAFLFAWRELLAAENHCDPRKYAWLEIYLEDMDADGFAEAILESHTLTLYLRPAEGGALFAFDVREAERPLIKGRSLIPRLAETPKALEHADWSQAAFEATKYRDRVHLAASHQGFLLKATYRPRPKQEAVELEWRIAREDEGSYRGYFGLDLVLADLKSIERPDAETARLRFEGQSLWLSSPRPFELAAHNDRIRLIFATEIPAGKSRRHRLELRVER